MNVSTRPDTPWKILIVDDEPEVHILTKTVLKGVTFDDRKLEFLSAYDCENARTLMRENDDLALILMDVVMEEDHSGLELVRYCREDLGNRTTRIILRTGQPGEAPERRIIIEYEINDYKEKVDLTSNRLFTSVVKSLRNYRDLNQINGINTALDRSRKGLTRIIETSSELFALRNLTEFYEVFPEKAASIIGSAKDDGIILYDPTESRIVRTKGRWKDTTDALPTSIVPACLQSACAESASPSRIWRENRIVTGRLNSPNGGNLCFFADEPENLADEDFRLMEIFFGNANIVFNNLSLEDESQATQTEMISLLGDVVENRSSELRGHVTRVSEFAEYLARKLNYPEEDLAIMRDAIPMHDIGKIGIYDSVLQKPGPLTPEEFDIMKQHTTIGYEILRFSTRKLFQMAAIIAWEHHERWDGSGYPRGLKGDEIHELGRITCIVDVFDALSSDRVYRKAWEFDKTVQFLRDGSGTQFEPRLVDLFLEDEDQIREIMARHKD